MTSQKAVDSYVEASEWRIFCVYKSLYNMEMAQQAPGTYNFS